MGVAVAERNNVADDTPDTVTLRVARVVYLMALGRRFTTMQVAELTGLSQDSAWDLMDRLSSSEHVPVTAIHTGPGRTLLWGLLVDLQDMPL